MTAYDVVTFSSSYPALDSTRFYNAEDALKCFKAHKRKLVEHYQSTYGSITEKKWDTYTRNEDDDFYFKCKTLNNDVYDIVFIDKEKIPND